MHRLTFSTLLNTWNKICWHIFIIEMVIKVRQVHYARRWGKSNKFQSWYVFLFTLTVYAKSTDHDIQSIQSPWIYRWGYAVSRHVISLGCHLVITGILSAE